jgi:hypothetical protein
MGTGRVRGYRTKQRLMFHTDRCDIVGLLCVRPARTGGLSSLVSSTRVYNEIVKNHPEYMQPLMNGYIHVSVEDGGDRSGCDGRGGRSSSGITTGWRRRSSAKRRPATSPEMHHNAAHFMRDRRGRSRAA